MNENRFNNTFDYKVIYIFKIYDEIHKGILKIGETTLKTNHSIDLLNDNSDELNKAAQNRIKQYTNTIGVQEELLYTTLAITNNKKVFKDKDVHRVLKNSGIKKHEFNNNKNPEEWFEINLETAINAINAVKQGRKALNRTEVEETHEDIEFRPEQKEAIELTLKRFEHTDRMLWNAKMRFGKTLSTLEVIKRMSKDDKYNLSRAIIITHRPAVDEGWFDDYTKIFYNDSEMLYGSKKRTTINELIKSKKKFIYFASMQDLRESNATGGKYNKNDEVFSINWDLVVIDEAHEGTQTELGQAVLKELIKSDNENHITKQLHLSGTPFNIMNEFEPKNTYTWDYIMEQKAKADWEENHPFEPNPYDDLPKMNIFTYNLKDYLPEYEEVSDKAFNFREFFRVWTGESEKDGKELDDQSKIGKFMHEDDVKRFLDLISHEDKESNYPFSKKEYIDNFKHSFWVVPGVKEALALKELMKKHEIFSMFNIVNVAGTGDDTGSEALDDVKKAIGNNPEDTYTITLSCGKLTTGVTVKAWTAVLYLAGSYSTSATSYLQAIFRVQSPANIGGKQKTECFVFDFAPDRTLKMVAQAGNLSIKAGSTGSREVMKQFLNFCPVISVEGSDMKPYNVEKMLQQLKRAYIDRVVDSGFDDNKIYNDSLYKLDENALTKFDKLKGIIGATKQKKKVNDIDINNQGFTNEEWEELEKIKNKKNNELTEEQRRLKEQKAEKDKQRNDAISILRGISIRIPLLIYGANIADDKEITIDNFVDIVDDLSWEEFMPDGVTKDLFKEFSQYYDNEIFIGAGRRIRNMAKYADTLSPIERAKTISNIFSTFRNPDKETVLTPWKTVNLHMGDTVGGYNFYDETYMVTIEEPRLINNGELTYDILFDVDSKILELNSKTGLYPLYITISLFKQRCLNTDSKKLTDEFTKALWDQTVAENIFVVCKTPMAKSITERTLIGYNKVKSNILYYNGIIQDLKKDPKIAKNKILNPKTWGLFGGENMKFDIVVGNPPYQEDIAEREEQPPLYHLFYDVAMMLSNKVTLITPARFLFGAGKTPAAWNKKMLNDPHFKVVDYFPSSKSVFDNVDIKGGVAITYRDENIDFGPIGTFVKDNNISSILQKVNPQYDESLSSIWYSNTSYKYSNIFFKEHPELEGRVSGGSARYMSSSVFDKFPEVFFKEDPNDGKKYSKIIGRQDSQRVLYYFEEKYLNPPNNYKKYKVFIASSNGTGELGETLSIPIIGEPFVGSTETFLSFGSFDTEEEAKNLVKYIRTKFARLMLGTKKVTQGNKNVMVWSNVPLQDFSNNSDIDWSLSIKDIDNKLYEKYGLDIEQIEYIEKTVKDM